MPFDVVVANSIEFLLGACLFFLLWPSPYLANWVFLSNLFNLGLADGSLGSVTLLPGA